MVLHHWIGFIELYPVFADNHMNNTCNKFCHLKCLSKFVETKQNNPRLYV